MLKEYSAYTKAALDYIDSHLQADLSIGQIASSLFISKLALQKHFKDDLKKPIGRYIDECLMEQAEQYLLDQKLSVKDISPSCFRHIHQV